MNVSDHDSNPQTSGSPPLAIVLMSGGLDSTTVLAIARAQGFAVTAVTFDYGQNHAIEVERARSIVGAHGAEHLVLELPFGHVGASALLGEGDVPDEPTEGAGHDGIPSTYVPARNTIFLSWALGLAEARQARDIFIGVNALDYSGYPDCRPEFIRCFERLANLATKEGVEHQNHHGEPYFRIHTPLAELTKADIIRKGVELGVDYAATLSCYQPDPHGGACGRCDSCGLRRRGFEQAGVPDPTHYSA